MSQPSAAIKEEVLREMATAIANNDWQATYDLFSLAQSIPDLEQKVDVFNRLLVMPGHELHQEVTREIQLLRSPSSVTYIRQVLANGFQTFQYTCSEQASSRNGLAMRSLISIHPSRLRSLKSLRNAVTRKSQKK